MEIFVVGTSHAVASAGVRERMHVDLDEVYAALVELREREGVLDEAIPLATCGRLELYCVSARPRRAVALLRRIMERRSGLARRKLERHAYLHTGGDAARHLCRVAAGLDSVIHGEAQILGQVRDALHHPATESVEGPILHRLFQCAISAGKRVRTETEIGRGAASLASAALEMLRRETEPLERLTVLVLGAGDTGALFARLLHKSGVRRMVIANRTVERAERLAAELGAESAPLSELPALLCGTDLVVGAVTAGDRIVGPDTLPRAERARRDDAHPGANGAARTAVAPPAGNGAVHAHHPRAVEPTPAWPRYFLDLAHPRNFDPALADIPGVRMFDLEHVFERVEAARRARAAQVPRAEAIVEEEAGEFLEWLGARDGVAVLRAVRSHVLKLAYDEASRYAHGRSEVEREQIRRFARALARRLLHHPTVALRTADPSSPQGRTLLDGAVALFGVDERTGSAPPSP